MDSRNIIPSTSHHDGMEVGDERRIYSYLYLWFEILSNEIE